MTRVRREVIRLCGAGLALATVAGCGGVSDGETAQTGEARDREEVRIVYVVESSWFSTDRETVSDNLDAAARHMTTCAESTERHCEVMMYAVQGAQVSSLRVPSTHTEDEKTGWWYSLDPAEDVGDDLLRRTLVSRRIDTFETEVADEIVPDDYPDQPIGCVNLVGTLSTAFEELAKEQGNRNIVVVFASGLSNCLGQPFYPDRPFPGVEDAVASVLAEVPPGSALIGGDDQSICVDWSPMFGQAFLEHDVYISQEQRQVLKGAWEEILDQWGAAQGNSPGEQLGSCLTMDVPS
jgi:hypothetical protein